MNVNATFIRASNLLRELFLSLPPSFSLVSGGSLLLCGCALSPFFVCADVLFDSTAQIPPRAPSRLSLFILLLVALCLFAFFEEPFVALCSKPLQYTLRNCVFLLVLYLVYRAVYLLPFIQLEPICVYVLASVSVRVYST